MCVIHAPRVSAYRATLCISHFIPKFSKLLPCGGDHAAHHYGGVCTRIILSGSRVYNTARYVGVAALEFAPAAAPWSVRVGGNAVGPYSPFDEPGVVLPAYGLLYVSGLARVASATVELGIRNLLDRAYPELVAGHVVSPGQPRSLSASLRYRF